MSKRTSRPSRDAAPSATDSRQEKKRARLERQLSKKHGEVLVEAKLIWNKVREKSRSAESRATLVTRLLELLTGKMLDVADRHDAARVMQSIVQSSVSCPRRTRRAPRSTAHSAHSSCVTSGVCSQNVFASSSATTNGNASQCAPLHHTVFTCREREREREQRGE